MRRTILTFISLGISFGLGLAFWLLAIYPNQSVLNETKEVTIERGMGGIAIANKLSEAGVIQVPQAFRLLSQLQGVGKRFQAGEYVFEAGITTAQVMEKLASGDIILRQVTIPEGKSSAEIIEIVNRADNLTGELKTIPKEGSLLPSTYRYTKGETRQSVIDRMQEAHTKLKAKIWDQRVDGLPFSSWDEAVTLASIVEKETGVAHERTHVAGLYINRLRIGMLLQADPTVAYGVYGGQYADKPLRRSDLRRDTPYNSYLHKGLPPTPICNPGKEALEAVLNPAKHDDLFMVATGTGGHYFAKTNAEHLKNVAKYRKWQKEQKVKR